MIDRIEGPSIAAGNIAVVMRAAAVTALDVRISEVSFAGQRWRDVRLNCSDLKQTRELFVCAQGLLESPARIPLSFSYSTSTKNLDLVLRPAADEEWRLTLDSGVTPRALTLAVNNGLLARINAWWPAGWPRPNSGRISGKLTFADAPGAGIRAELALGDMGFSDDGGLHAGEKIAAGLSLQAQRRGEQWLWQSRIGWKTGDVFWQPLFVRGEGQALTAAGVLDAKRIAVDQGRLTFAGIGNVEFSGIVDRMTGSLAAARVKAVNIAVAASYEKLLKPMLQGTALGDIRSEGHADIALEVADGAIVGADLVLKRVSVEDRARRFALFALDGRLPWQRGEATSGTLRLGGGEVLRVPFGAFNLPLEMHGLSVRMQVVQIPVLDGRMRVSDFALTGERDSWRWRFSGGIAPISMQRLTAALGLPAMHGALSADIPAVSYQQSTLKIDGALLFKVFDGTVTVQDLVLESPLGKVPRLTADVDMRKLDLDLLTRTFSFGNITGRLDAEINALELVNWEPVRFDARIASSAGEYPRRISQAAVQNISALGGAGAETAIQRSLLRFFEQFGYSALGLSCTLENGVCRMGGLEDVPQGYVIVKGGGIPAISVIGYNRSVGWHELISRLKRVTQDNVRPVVK